jgi:hypothetical protein
VSQQTQVFPVVVKKLKKDEKGRKVEDGCMPDYAPAFIEAESATQAREIVLAKLVKEDIYDPADPMVSITACSPFVAQASDRY